MMYTDTMLLHPRPPDSTISTAKQLGPKTAHINKALSQQHVISIRYLEAMDAHAPVSVR